MSINYQPSTINFFLHPAHKALVYLARALRLRCPLCGKSPLFLPLRQTRSLYDWLTPLDGCPRCGYAYDREAGYWLVPVWIIGFGFSCTVGFLSATIGLIVFDYDPLTVSIAGSCATAATAFLGARHAKAIFIAIDRYIDPEEAAPTS